MGLRTTLGHAAHHMADAIEIVPCSTCFEDAVVRKPDGPHDYLYACTAHGEGVGWESFTQKMDSQQNPEG